MNLGENPVSKIALGKTSTSQIVGEIDRPNRADLLNSLKSVSSELQAHMTDAIFANEQRQYNFYVCTVRSVFGVHPNSQAIMEAPFFDATLIVRYTAVTAGLIKSELDALAKVGKE